MIVADWVFLGIIIGGLALGALFGFGGVFKFFTTGIFGIILSVLGCFLIGTAFLGAFTPLLDKVAAGITASDNWFCQFLGKLNIQVVLYYVIMFLIIWLLRFILVRVVKYVSSIDNKGIKVLNRVFGAVLFLAILLVLGFLVLWVIGWVGGPTSDNFYNYLCTGKLGLGNLYKFIASYTAPEETALLSLIV